MYVMQVERLDRHMHAVSAALVAAGADALSLPDETRAKFDEDLAAEPVAETRAQVLARRLEVV